MKPTQTTGTAGTGAGTAGTSGGGGTTGVGTGGVGNTGFDASFDISTADSKSDGVCAATMTAAEPVPLDLYVTVDISKSMALTSRRGPRPSGTRVKSALNTFFADPKSAGLGAGLGYFPLVQSSIPASCTAMGRVARTGRATGARPAFDQQLDHRRRPPLRRQHLVRGGQNCVAHPGLRER